MDDVSEDAILGGRLRLRQPRRGHRVGHDAVLLAAACPARAGDAVVELGAGVGAAGLAVAARVPGVSVTLIEIDPALAALVEENARLNGLADRARTLVLDVTASARAFANVGLAPDTIERVLMNPPFNDPLRQRASSDPSRRLAHAAPRSMLAAWARTAARLLRPRGTLTLIWRADGLGDVLDALNSAFGDIVVLPVHGKPGQPAIRVLVRAIKASHAPLQVLPSLILADESGRMTTEAEAILRGGEMLPLAAV
jgi:tRNA1(Val) A37 N6-methylase TrmN6